MTGSIIKRSRKSWTIVLDVGLDSKGKRRQRWVAVKGTKRDAEKELTRLLNAIHVGAYVEPTRLSVADYLKRWLNDYAKPNVAAKTLERYTEIVSLHLIPALGPVLLAKLQPLHIQSYYSTALESGRRDRKDGGLSAQTVLHHHRVLKQALRQAVRWQLVVRNVADAVEPPKPVRREMQVLDEKQMATLLESLKGARLYMPILLAMTTGLRRGEVLGVRWRDVDLDGGTLAVRQSLQQVRGMPLSFKQPKSKKARVVALPGLLVEALRRHKAEQAKERLLLGPAYEDHDLVCARLHGTPLAPNEVTAGFADLVRKSDVPKVRLHDLRHSHATQLLRQKVHPKIVSERLGHATVGITLDVYSHVLPTMQEEAARGVDAALRQAIKAGRES